MRRSIIQKGRPTPKGHKRTFLKRKRLAHLLGATIVLCSTRLALAADAPGLETANIRKFVSYFSPNDFKIVDSGDLYAAPAKFIGQPIELRNVRCLYAMDGYHCIAPQPGMVTIVSAKSVAPAAEREALKNDCAEIQAMAHLPACRKNVRIIPADLTESSLPNYAAKRVVMTAERIEIHPASQPKH